MLLAVPVADKVEHRTHTCLTNIFHSLILSGYEYAYHNKQSANLHASRNRAVQVAYENGCSHVLFIDSDMTFPDGVQGGMENVVEQLLRHDRDIIGALAVRKRAPHFPNIANFDEENQWFVNILDWPEDALIEVDAIGTSTLLIKLSVFDRISEHFFSDIPFKDHNWFGFVQLRTNNSIKELGMDYSFCYRAMKAGLKIFCDTSIPIGHIGSYTFTVNDFSVYKEEAFEHNTAKVELTKARVIKEKEIEPDTKTAIPADNNQEAGK